MDYRPYRCKVHTKSGLLRNYAFAYCALRDIWCSTLAVCNNSNKADIWMIGLFAICSVCPQLLKKLVRQITSCLFLCVCECTSHLFMPTVPFEPCKLGSWKIIYCFLMEKIADPYFFLVRVMPLSVTAHPHPPVQKWDGFLKIIWARTLIFGMLIGA